jgi:hypothetical protein
MRPTSPGRQAALEERFDWISEAALSRVGHVSAPTLEHEPHEFKAVRDVETMDEGLDLRMVELGTYPSQVVHFDL